MPPDMEGVQPTPAPPASALGSQNGSLNPKPPQSLGKRRRDGEDGAASTDSAPSNLYQCGHCNKSYSRVDHLRRHVRVHTQERPYICQVCGNSFARADLLKRHVAGHDAQASRNAAKSSPKSAARQGRVGQACEACADLHLKCDDEKPCNRCKTKRLECQYQLSAVNEMEAIAPTLLSLAQQPVLDRNHQGYAQQSYSDPMANGPMLYNGPDSQEPSRAGSVGFDMLGTPRMTEMYHGMAPPPPKAPMSNGVTFAPRDSTNNLVPRAPGSVHEDPSPSNETEGHELHHFLQQVMGEGTFANLSQTNNGLGTWTPRNLFEFGMDTNLELNDIDLSFLDDYNQSNPFGMTTPTQDTAPMERYFPGETHPDPPLGVESLQKSSTWRFRPQSKDSREGNLSLPATDSLKTLTVDRRVTPETLQYTTRDQILSIIIITAGSSSRSVLSFPSVELLDSLLQYYLTATPAPSSLIHAASFRPSQKRPELVASMIAAGATLAPDAPLRKLGFAIQEAVQISIPQKIESDNSLTRNLECLQASLICLNIALWSGNSRKMEMAESFLQPWATMVRRSGWLGRKYQNITPLPDDQGQVLEEKWHRWIEEESRKRLVFWIFQHDAQASNSLFINPIISYAELALPLPHSQTLWLAKTAQAWKTLFLVQSQPQGQIPTVVDLLQNIDLYVENRDLFDSNIATRAMISAFWSLVWEYRQQSSITRTQPNQWNSGTLLLSSRLTELKRLLECLRMGAPDTPATNLYLELLSMHLHMSLEEVHLFAGVEGHEEAKRVYPALREWVKTPGARQAVWHAGQLIRNAKDMPGLRDFNAVAVYQAGLAFWCYGVISNASASGVSGQSQGMNQAMGDMHEPIVLLNEPGSTTAQRFIALNRGRPALASGSGEHKSNALLSDPGSVMVALMDLLKASHKSRSSRPPLVENLLELMRGLKTAVTGTGNGSGTTS